VRQRQEVQEVPRPIAETVAAPIVAAPGIDRAALSIVFSNPHLVVVDKPAGWLSVPSRLGRLDARPCVGIALQQQLAARLWPAHRLDEEVSGLLLFARTAEAHRRLGQGFEAHTIEKTYAALCEGAPPDDAPPGQTVRFTSTLLRGKRRAYVHAGGKPAITDVQRVETAPRLRFLLWPRTGRAHQLRVELSRRGCPIVGDALYGAQTAFLGGGIALRAVALDFSRFPDAACLGLPPRIEAAKRF
jgi:tRNA pseudouridine32 synthase/23S rRNA pseudouridine746 synthase